MKEEIERLEQVLVEMRVYLDTYNKPERIEARIEARKELVRKIDAIYRLPEPVASVSSCCGATVTYIYDGMRDTADCCCNKCQKPCETTPQPVKEYSDKMELKQRQFLAGDISYEEYVKSEKEIAEEANAKLDQPVEPELRERIANSWELKHYDGKVISHNNASHCTPLSEVEQAKTELIDFILALLQPESIKTDSWQERPDRAGWWWRYTKGDENCDHIEITKDDIVLFKDKWLSQNSVWLYIPAPSKPQEG
jgi:hypothetical protein